MSKKLFYAISLVLLLSSCTKEDLEGSEEGRVDNDSVRVEAKSYDKEALKAEFARVLSSVVYENQDVREFLKNEAVLQFDKNYDVLYISIKDKLIGKRTFRELLVETSSEDFMDDVEAGVPLLNILFPKLAMFNLSPEQYDSNDNELPVAFAATETNDLYFNGECTDHLEKGQIPGFYTLVVNENNRVIVSRDTRGVSSFTFKYPEYDGSKKVDLPVTRGLSVPDSLVGNKAYYSYQYFYADDSGIHSRALQRDYIYFGMTSANQPGALNYSVREYLSFIKVNPAQFGFISDQRSASSGNDPYIINYEVSKKKTDFTEEELLDAMWMRNSYNFRVEVQSSNSTSPAVKMIALRPEDLWDFNLTFTYQHDTWFRPKKFTYTIDPLDFTAKRCDLLPLYIDLGKWDLTQEALTRRVTFIEEDQDVTETVSYAKEFSQTLSTAFNNTTKLQLGLGVSAEGQVATQITNSNTIKRTVNISFTRKQTSDNLGSSDIYFYDPIIDYMSGSMCLMHSYNTGAVEFGITAF